MSSTSIKSIHAREILDSRGNPTVETTVTLEDGTTGTASVPSGASTGTYEAHELRDGDAGRYEGKGVLKACKNVNTIIAQALADKTVDDIPALDRSMIDLDGTASKSNLGANAILSVSLAASRAAAAASNVPLYAHLAQSFGFASPTRMPAPIMNLVNGGKHASTNLALQEFQIVFSQSDAQENVEAGSEIFHALGGILAEHGLDTDVGNEGGYAPEVESIEQVFEMLSEAVGAVALPSGIRAGIGLDAAASSFYNDKRKTYEIAPPREELSPKALSERYRGWAARYGIISIEDPFSEGAWADWSSFTASAKGLLVIGDDLVVTNPKRLARAIREKAINAVLIKPNQIGTLTETVAAVKLAQQHHLAVAVSHRSGETDDAFIADFAVAVGADYLKAGAPSRGERVAKYNRLMEIEEALCQNH